MANPASNGFLPAMRVGIDRQRREPHQVQTLQPMRIYNTNLSVTKNSTKNI